KMRRVVRRRFGERSAGRAGRVIAAELSTARRNSECGIRKWLHLLFCIPHFAPTPLDPCSQSEETPAAMRLLTRYVLWELLKVFLVALTVLTVVLLMYGLVKQAHDEGLGPQQVLMLIPYILPAMLRYTIPATLLFAASSVYGRMSGSNEVVAIKSLGISPMAVLWPCF